MSPRIGVQLYALKEPWGRDRVATLERVAALGIEGVEAAGYGEPASFRKDRIARGRELREQVATAGLELIGVHTMLPDPADAGWLFEELAETGTQLAIASTPERVLGFTRDVFDDASRLDRFADRFNDLVPIAADHGMRIGYHTHWWEWSDLDGIPALDRFVGALDPSVVLEVDLFWAQSAGQDAARVVESFGDRVELVHVKDGDGVVGSPQVAAGSGSIRLDEALRAGESIRWQVLEVDLIAEDADIWHVVGDGVGWLRSRG